MIAGKMKNEIEEKLNKSIASEDGDGDLSVSSSPKKSSWIKLRRENKEKVVQEDEEAFERALSAVNAATITDTDGESLSRGLPPKPSSTKSSPSRPIHKRVSSGTTAGSFTTVTEF